MNHAIIGLRSRIMDGVTIQVGGRMYVDAKLLCGWMAR